MILVIGKCTWQNSEGYEQQVRIDVCNYCNQHIWNIYIFRIDLSNINRPRFAHLGVSILWIVAQRAILCHLCCWALFRLTGAVASGLKSPKLLVLVVDLIARDRFVVFLPKQKHMWLIQNSHSWDDVNYTDLATNCLQKIIVVCKVKILLGSQHCFLRSEKITIALIETQRICHGSWTWFPNHISFSNGWLFIF